MFNTISYSESKLYVNDKIQFGRLGLHVYDGHVYGNAHDFCIRTPGANWKSTIRLSWQGPEILEGCNNQVVKQIT